MHRLLDSLPLFPLEKREVRSFLSSFPLRTSTLTPGISLPSKQLHKFERTRSTCVRSQFLHHPIPLSLNLHLDHSYYLQRSHESDTTEVLAFPEGMRMLAGNPYVRSRSRFSQFSTSRSYNEYVDSILQRIISDVKSYRMELFGRRYFGIGSNEESLVTPCELSRSFEFHFTLPALCVMNTSMQQNGLRGEIMFPSCWGEFDFFL